jgi:hypothetical protein
MCPATKVCANLSKDIKEKRVFTSHNADAPLPTVHGGRVNVLATMHSMGRKKITLYKLREREPTISVTTSWPSWQHQSNTQSNNLYSAMVMVSVTSLHRRLEGPVDPESFMTDSERHPSSAGSVSGVEVSAW